MRFFEKFGVFQNWWVLHKFLGWFLCKWFQIIMHCITCAVLKMFMHFRRVITMLKCCVLVGFDWTEPMILLMLHVTCSCILHAYVLIFVSIIWYKTIWFFSVCLSLSFFRSVASFFASPSDSTPSHIRFHDDKARKDFSKNFSWRGFHSKCQVVL